MGIKPVFPMVFCFPNVNYENSYIFLDRQINLIYTFHITKKAIRLLQNINKLYILYIEETNYMTLK